MNASRNQLNVTHEDFEETKYCLPSEVLCILEILHSLSQDHGNLDGGFHFYYVAVVSSHTCYVALYVVFHPMS